MIRDIEMDLEKRIQAYAANAVGPIQTAANARFEEWLQGIKDRFFAEEQAKYQAEKPQPTFQSVAQARLKSMMPQDEFRAGEVARLAALRDEHGTQLPIEERRRHEAERKRLGQDDNAPLGLGGRQVFG